MMQQCSYVSLARRIHHPGLCPGKAKNDPAVPQSIWRYIALQQTLCPSSSRCIVHRLNIHRVQVSFGSFAPARSNR